LGSYRTGGIASIERAMLSVSLSDKILWTRDEVIKSGMPEKDFETLLKLDPAKYEYSLQHAIYWTGRLKTTAMYIPEVVKEIRVKYALHTRNVLSTVAGRRSIANA
jgi:hypothetical protein